MCPTGPRGFFISGSGPAGVSAGLGAGRFLRRDGADMVSRKGHGVGASTVTPSDVAGTVGRAANRARTTMTGAQSLVRSLEHVGVDVVFGIPGGAILPAYDPLRDSEKVRHVLVRHEQGAGHAAQGYAAATGRVGVCMATSGPGATNLVTPIADADIGSVPIAAITGQVAS